MAEQILQRALAIPGGTDLTQEAAVLNDLARLSIRAGRNERATDYLIQALDRLGRGLGREHPSQVSVLQNLALAYSRQHRLREALETSRRALSLVDRRLPEAHPLHEAVLLGYAELLRQSGQKSEAKRMEARARNVHAVAADSSRHIVDVTELKTRPR